jgi:hypothetical protein
MDHETPEQDSGLPDLTDIPLGELATGDTALAREAQRAAESADGMAASFGSSI